MAGAAIPTLYAFWKSSSFAELTINEELSYVYKTLENKGFQIGQGYGSSSEQTVQYFDRREQ